MDPFVALVQKFLAKGWDRNKIANFQGCSVSNVDAAIAQITPPKPSFEEVFKAFMPPALWDRSLGRSERSHLRKLIIAHPNWAAYRAEWKIDASGLDRRHCLWACASFGIDWEAEILKAKTGLTEWEIAVAKGLLERGEHQHDIASYFGVNAGRIAEIATGQTGADIKAAYAFDLPKTIRLVDIRKDYEQRFDSAGKVMRELAMEVASLKRANKELQNTIDRMVDAERVRQLKANHAEMEKATALFEEIGRDPFN